MGKGIFPQMSIPDIINALSGWGLSVSHEQLIRPSADFVESIYCACLQQVTDIDHEALRDPVQTALVACNPDDKDLYASALTHNLLIHHLSRFAKAARVEDFSAKDVFIPERERTLILLSAFINFVKFTEQYCHSFVKDLQARSENINVERDHVYEELSEVQRNIDTVKAKIAEDEPRCEQLRNENSALRSKMIATKELQTAAVKEVENLKAEKNALIKRKEALNSEVTTVSEAISRTRSRIVQSPERIKRTITAMSAATVEDKKSIAMHEAKARELQAKINALQTIEKDIRGCVEQLHSIEKEISALRATEKGFTEVKDRLYDKTVDRNELKLRRERVEKQLSNAYDKLERAQRHAEEKKAASQRTIERLQREYDEMALERKDNDKQVEELRTEANDIEAKIAEHMKVSEAELNELLAEYWKLRHETDVYMETLANKLNMQVTAE